MAKHKGQQRDTATHLYQQLNWVWKLVVCWISSWNPPTMQRQQRPRRYCMCVSNLHSSIAIAILSTLLRITAMVLVVIFFQTQSQTSGKIKIFFIVAMTLMSVYILVDMSLLWGIYRKIKGLLYFWITMAVLWLALMILKIFMDFAPPGKNHTVLFYLEMQFIKKLFQAPMWARLEKWSFQSWWPGQQ